MTTIPNPFVDPTGYFHRGQLAATDAIETWLGIAQAISEAADPARPVRSHRPGFYGGTRGRDLPDHCFEGGRQRGRQRSGAVRPRAGHDRGRRSGRRTQPLIAPSTHRDSA